MRFECKGGYGEAAVSKEKRVAERIDLCELPAGQPCEV